MGNGAGRSPKRLFQNGIVRIIYAPIPDQNPISYSGARAMRSQAEAEAAGEEQRIKAAAEEDARKIVESAGQEVEAAARLAQRDLKAYAAELAVSLAEKRIQVDAATDRALVQNFVGQLGQNGDEEGK